jgi:hypothetical protein
MSLLDGLRAPLGGGGQGAEREGLRVLLGSGRLGETWLLEDAVGRRATKRLRVEPRFRARALAGLQRLTEVSGPNLVPVLGGLQHGDEVWVDAELAPGMPLRRVLSIAVLTPGQAALVVEGVLAALDALRAAGLAHGHLHDNQVHLGPDGDVRVGDWGLQALVTPRGSADEERAAHLFGQLASEHRPTPAWRTGAASRFRDLALGRDGSELALAELRQTAALVLEEVGRERAARELAALVRALERRTETSPSPPEPLLPPPLPTPLQAEPVPGPTGVPLPLDATRPPVRLPSDRGLFRWGLGGVAAAAVVAIGLWAGLHAHGQRPAVVRQAARPAATSPPLPVRAPASPPTPTPGPSPVPALAPQQAGPITGVQLQALGPCGPGTTCEVRVQVNLTGDQSSLPLAWNLTVFDRCTGAVTQLPGVEMTAGAGWNYAWGISYPTLPAGRSLALVAVTTVPAQAASAPLMIGSGAACS